MVENAGHYKELELRERGVGKMYETRTHEWTTKLSTYRDERVKAAFSALKRSIERLCTGADGYVYHEIALRVAQLMMDSFLLKRSKGLDVSVPEPVVCADLLNPKPAAKDGVPDENAIEPDSVKADFATWDGKINTVQDINWIYNSLMLKDVRKEDAPSPGAWAHLQYYRSSESAMADFFNKLYPRLIPAKAAIQRLEDKLHDDGRTTFGLIERLLKEAEGSAEPVSVLPLGDKERPGL